MSLQAYKNQQDYDILSATPLELVRALYRGAIQAVRTARTALAAGQIRERSEAITKAGAIIQELTLSLDREIGGDVAGNLAELYVYMHTRLGEANIQQADAPLAEVEKLLVTLAEAWNQIPDLANEPAAMRLSA
ncbi:MAG: flagellar export chaperone FliS [Acidobacteria bacterium]|nr:flagellar export chaperone FliS [Acidobacteriota bacterium]